MEVLFILEFHSPLDKVILSRSCRELTQEPSIVVKSALYSKPFGFDLCKSQVQLFEFFLQLAHFYLSASLLLQLFKFKLCPCESILSLISNGFQPLLKPTLNFIRTAHGNDISLPLNLLPIVRFDLVF